ALKPPQLFDRVVCEALPHSVSGFLRGRCKEAFTPVEKMPNGPNIEVRFRRDLSQSKTFKTFGDDQSKSGLNDIMATFFCVYTCRHISSSSFSSDDFFIPYRMVGLVRLSILGKHQESVEISSEPTIVGYRKDCPFKCRKCSLKSFR